MENKLNNKKNLALSSKKRIIVAIILVLVAGMIGLFFVVQPQRTVANFCRVAKEEKPTLVGDVNYEKRLDAYKKLETVSPDEIRPDISTIRKGYEDIVKSPSNTLSTGFGMSGAENRRTAYIESNCKDF